MSDQHSPGPTRWALIGASDIASTRIIPAIRAHGGHIQVVQSGDESWATEYAERHEVDAWTTSVDDAVGRDDVDAVYVSSHNAKHRDQVITAAEAGKHVLAEKPLALSLDDALAMVEVCENAGIVMATNHHLPASPTHMVMKEIVASGEIGSVRAVHVNHAVGIPDRLRGWRVDDPVAGGVILDVFIHDMAAVRAIVGGQARSVMAAARRGPDVPAAPNSVMTVVEWTDDIIVQTHDAYDNYHLPSGLEILGDGGAIGSSESMTGDPVGDVTVYHDGVGTPAVISVRDDLYLTTVRSFDAAIHTGVDPLVTGLDGVRSLAAALAAQQSLDTGCIQSVPSI
ncbi:MAG: Gfo/Idh/MocA family oxidoreductase [Acidimicrobiales bacterium]|nr:Gfo/Idh/MocA family oxidoreductase [Acidimicrobiales bacterium]RZV45192.1 MAG: Gfo/Idh/MocA family oxidoreductase [Acidimicrobiia bacterium]